MLFINLIPIRKMRYHLLDKGILIPCSIEKTMNQLLCVKKAATLSSLAAFK